MRNFSKLQHSNDGSRSLTESAIAVEVMAALKDWKANTKTGVLIGGLALSYWAKPRYTEGVDMLFLQPTDVPVHVEKFKAHRKGAFEHKATNVEVEYVHGGNVPVPQNVIDEVFRTAIVVDGFKAATPSALIALKLHRFWLRDQSDIVTLNALGGIDLSKFKLSKGLLKKFDQLIKSHGHEN